MEGRERRRRHAGEEWRCGRGERLPGDPRALGLAARDRRAARREDRDHEGENQKEDDQAVGARVPIEALHARRQEEEPARERIEDGDRHEHGEQVLSQVEEPVERHPQPGEIPVPVEADGERLEGAHGEDQETPEDEEVHEAGDRILEQLLLAEDEGEDAREAAPV